MIKILVIFFAFIIIATSFNTVSAAVIIPVSSKISRPAAAEVKAAIDAFKSLPAKRGRKRYGK